MRGRRWLEALRAAACAAACAFAAVSAPADAAQGARAVSYLALGDSYTIGEGVPAQDRWTYRLAQALRDAGVPLTDPRTIATTGWTTDELSDAIDAEAPDADYGFVSLAIGVNNEYRGRDADDYAPQFEALLLRAIRFAQGDAGRVLVLSIPDWGATRYGRASGRDLAQVAQRIDAYNAAARAICERHGVAFVDITPLSRELGDDSDALAEDGLHPSASQYARWAALAAPVVRQRLDAATTERQAPARSSLP